MDASVVSPGLPRRRRPGFAPKAGVSRTKYAIARLTPEEREIIDELNRVRGMKDAELIRTLLLGEARKAGVAVPEHVAA